MAQAAVDEQVGAAAVPPPALCHHFCNPQLRERATIVIRIAGIGNGHLAIGAALIGAAFLNLTKHWKEELKPLP